MDEEAIYDFIEVLAEMNYDLDDLGLTEDDLLEMDADDFNTIINSLDEIDDEDDDEDEDED